MSDLQSFLRDRLAAGGFTTEDTLASVLPLMRQVVEAHARGLVAPLDGLAALQVEGVQIWFEEARLAEPAPCTDAVRALDRPRTGAVEVVEEVRRASEVDEATSAVTNLAVASREDAVTRLVYLPGYVAWEQQLGCHDPLTDVFNLGMLLASVACGLDLNDPADVARFAAHRRNLFALAPDLHPVLVQAIVRMTALSRHERPQELGALLRTLTHYRDQELDLDVALLQIEGFAQKPPRDRQQIVLGKLQERLFEISRANRLLQFRPTAQTINLTHASVPLSFDVERIRPDQLLTWSHEFKQDVLAGRPIALNKYLNFAEALYLPSVLDKIRAEESRDQTEFGFAQLRLVLCFLHWSDLKDPQRPRFNSPLVLLPTRLVRRKGVRDRYVLEPFETEAEVNPVLRHQFKQLYDIDLPESLELTETAIEDLYTALQARIRASEPAVALERIDRPRIDLIHDLARRRLDQYTRRIRLSGRGVRKYLDLDYSYDPANYHPLGLRLFNERVRPSQTHLSRVIEEKPRARQYVAPAAEEPAATRARTFYALRDDAGDNPYQWGFDLCSVTLGNFKYRKMSLVRDYRALLERPVDNPVFDAAFSLAPRAVEPDVGAALPLEDRYPVVPCDPTQAAAIAEARSGRSYVIQGPPGTGKSQTITNLIADYAMRGKRVLFVCEKRAAIDVVYQRLKERGLGDLACLIHDSQADKKAFVLDLKATYEAFLGAHEHAPDRSRQARAQLVDAIRRELSPLEHFDRAMRSAPDGAGATLHALVRRAIALAEHAVALSPLALEAIPPHGVWCEQRPRIAQLVQAMAEIQRDAVLANHPLHLLSPRLVAHDRPLQRVTEALDVGVPLLQSLVAAADDVELGDASWETLGDLRHLVEHSVRLDPLARIDRLAVLDAGSDASRRFAVLQADLRKLRRAADDAAEAARGWRQRLSREEAGLALEQARALQGGWFAALRPAWWRLRGILHRCYDFGSHVVRPSWTHVIESLLTAYRTADAVTALAEATCEEHGVTSGLDEFLEAVERARSAVAALPARVRAVHDRWIANRVASPEVRALAALAGDLQRLLAAFDGVIDDYEDRSPAQLRAELAAVQGALGELPEFLQCLGEIAQLPGSLATVFRRHRLTPAQIEAATIERSLAHALRSDRRLDRFTGPVRSQQLERLAERFGAWEQRNAEAVREQVRARFLEHARIAGLPGAQLTADQREFKAHYNRGRRELEHEFGKSMRYRSIRALAAGDSGRVINDLKPIWLMSPLSVSDTLPLGENHFDVVIFDEASQITLEEAIPSIFRASQAIIVGDEQQLPPTNFFSAKQGEDDSIHIEADGATVEYDLSSTSFLNHAARNLPARMLGWHYRSRSEALISFSNWAFYQGRLLTVPDERLGATRRPPIRVVSPDTGGANCAAVLDRPVGFHLLEHGAYDKGRNRPEAEYIAQLVRGLLMEGAGRSIGVVAFSEAQQEEIEAALARLAEDDPAFRAQLDAEMEREVDGQFVGLLVKNLENIQGDERDIVIMSVCYGPGPQAKMRMNFGPINQSGGERRLNVAFSRAKHHMALVSSIRHGQITNDYNDGARCLKNYLRYAEACSEGDQATALRVLHELAVTPEPANRPSAGHDDVVVAQVADALRQRGYEVALGVGQSRFRCDLAIWRPGDDVYRLGLSVDTEAYYGQTDLLERELLKPSLLRRFGWRILHVLGTDWHKDRARVLERIERVLGGAEETPEADPEFDAAFAAPPVAPAPAAASPLAAPLGASPIPIDAPTEPGLPVASPATPRLRRYFELISDASSKFWEITVSGLQHSVRFGRIGTSGQERAKSFPTEAGAHNDAERLIREKLGKGYVEKPGTD